MVKRLVPYPPFNTELLVATNLDEQLEIIGRYLTAAELELTQNWEGCEVPADLGDGESGHAWRYVTFTLRNGAAVLVYAREMPGRADSIQLRRIHVVRPPE